MRASREWNDNPLINRLADCMRRSYHTEAWCSLVVGETPIRGVPIVATLTCRNCGNVFTVPDWLSGDVNCPACRKPVSQAAATRDSAEDAPDCGSQSIAESRGAERSEASNRAAVLSSAMRRLWSNASAIAVSAVQRISAVMLRMPRPKWAVRRWFTGRNKFLLFGLIGTLGCSLGALFGELVLVMTRVRPPDPPAQPVAAQAVCLLIDCSGSMDSGERFFSLTTKLSEVKSAAKDFAQRQSGTENEIAVIGFGSMVQPGTGLTKDCSAVERAIDGLRDGGDTGMGAGLSAAASELDAASLGRNILLFTDGMPNSPEETLEAAEVCRRRDIKIVAIATGDADVGFLARVTGDRSLVIPVTAGSFGQGFDQAARVIYGRSLVESFATGASFKRSLLRVAGWTASLALGLSLALIAGQNLYLGRQFLSLSEGSIGTLGGLAAGLAAGAAGQLLFSPFSKIAFLQSLATVVGWSVLGALVGRGIAYFVPNLASRRAWIGGGIGGGIAAIAFLWTSTYLSDVLGRLLGAGILGLVIGLLIAWIEAAFREAWLEVRFAPNENANVSLGPKAVSIGSDGKACTVFVFGAAPVALRYWMRNGIIECQDVSASQTMQVQPGDQRQVGNVTVTVCGAG